MASVSDTSSIAESPEYASILPSMRREDLEIKKILGEGGFGIVYKAEHTKLGTFALKQCKNTLPDEETLKLVIKEVKQMVKVSHYPYIVQICGIIPHSPKTDCCIVMEYMEYGSLHSFQKRLTTFPKAFKIKMVLDIALGMNYLHSLSPEIIHRDLKLENVFVGTGFVAKVGDLGLATWCTVSSRMDPKIVGTMTHIAPEILNDINLHPTPKLDVYSFGIMLWEFVTGCQPYENCIGNSDLLKYGVKSGQRPDDCKIPHDEPDILKELMRESWRQDPDQRPTFQDIKERLQENTKRDYNEERADIYSQLQLNDKSPKSSEELGAKARPSDNPQPLHSVDNVSTTEPTRYAVPVSDTQQVGNLPGMSKILEKLSLQEPQIDEDKPSITETMPTKPVSPGTTVSDYASPIRQRETIAIQPSDTAYHTREAQHAGLIHNTPGCLNQGGSLASPVNKAAVSGARQVDPKYNINITGHGNYVTTAEGNSTINFFRKKKKRKSEKKKKITPPSSSSSSSSSSEEGYVEIDSVVDTATSITTSQAPVTQSDIDKIAGKIGKNYMKLGRKLGLKQPDIENIEADNHGDQHEMAFQVMLTWMKRSLSEVATKATLAKALVAVGLQNVAEKL